MSDGDGYQSYAQRYVPRYHLPVKFSVCVPVLRKDGEEIYMPDTCYMYLVELIGSIRIGLSLVCHIGIFRNIRFTLVYLYTMVIHPDGILLL